MLMLSKQLEKKLSDSDSFPYGQGCGFLENESRLRLKNPARRTYLNETGNKDDSLREAMLTLERIYAVTYNASETGMLLDAGFGSATQIVNMGSAAFGLKVAGLISLERAGEIFAVAEKVVTSTRSRG